MKFPRIMMNMYDTRTGEVIREVDVTLNVIKTLRLSRHNSLNLLEEDKPFLLYDAYKLFSQDIEDGQKSEYERYRNGELDLDNSNLNKDIKEALKNIGTSFDAILDAERYLDEVSGQKWLIELARRNLVAFDKGTVLTGPDRFKGVECIQSDYINDVYNDGFVDITSDRNSHIRDITDEGVMVVNATKKDYYELTISDMNSFLEDLECNLVPYMYDMRESEIETSVKSLIEGVIESSLDGTYEDAADDLVHPDDFMEKIFDVAKKVMEHKTYTYETCSSELRQEIDGILKEYNAAQNIVTYYPDDSRFIALPPEYNKEDARNYMVSVLEERQQKLTDMLEDGWHPKGDNEDTYQPKM